MTATACLVMMLSAQGDGSTVAVGTCKQLLVDDYVIAERTNVTRELGAVVKANGGKPVFTEGQFYGTVLFHEGRFKLWFREFDNEHYGYAESPDGIHFAIKGEVTGIPFAGDINLAVSLDPHETDPAHRFKAGFDAVGMAAGLAHSADGIHWTPYHDGQPVTCRAADTINQIVWDPLAQAYRLSTRTDFGAGGGPLASTVAPDFEVRGTRMMLNPDVKADPAKWELVRHWHFDREGPKEYLRRQIYALPVWIYEDVYFGLMSVYDYPADISEGTSTDQVSRHERNVMNYYLATSRDGDDWDLEWVYAGRPFVPRGPDGAFDNDMIMPGSTIVTHNDTHWVYYGGANERHSTVETDPPVRYESVRAIGLATLPMDRFVALAAGDEPGVVVTRPFVVQGNSLELNVDAHDGDLRCEVLDANGTPLEGYAGDAGFRRADVDELRLAVRWRDGIDLKQLQGKRVRLRFRLRNAKLYAFRVTPPR